MMQKCVTANRRRKGNEMQFTRIMLELLDKYEVLQVEQILWYAEELDEKGTAEKVIGQALHNLIRGREVYIYEEHGVRYVSRSEIKRLSDYHTIQMSLFWVLLDAMPGSKNHELNMHKIFQLTYLNNAGRLVQVAYIPRNQERGICRLIHEMPESSYERDDCRIALLEDADGIEKIRRVGFSYIVTINHTTTDTDAKIQILKTVPPEEIWEDM